MRKMKRIEGWVEPEEKKPSKGFHKFWETYCNPITMLPDYQKHRVVNKIRNV